MRLEENGLLRRDDGTASVLALLQMMARTPQGSWQGCLNFGLRDLFEDQRMRADAARLAQQRINEAFRDLGITHYTVTEVVREFAAQQETDVYAITLQNSLAGMEISTQLSAER